MEWNFLTTFLPDKTGCEDYGNCKRPVRALSHKVRWQDDGGLNVLSSNRRTGEGLAIDRAETDATFVLTPVDLLVRNGQLDLGPTGGTFQLAGAASPGKSSISFQPRSMI